MNWAAQAELLADAIREPGFKAAEVTASAWRAGVHAEATHGLVGAALALTDGEAMQSLWAQAEPCPSCGGREFYVMATAPSPDDQTEGGPYEELLARARAQGVDELDVTGAAVWGQLDELLGDGAQALAEAAQRQTVYLLTPCGCTEDRVRTVRRSELGSAA